MTENGHVDLGGNLNKYIFFPLFGIDQVGDGEEDVSCVVCFVLFKDNVAPGLVEVSGCHVGAAETIEERNQLSIYISLQLSFLSKVLIVIIFSRGAVPM